MVLSGRVLGLGAAGTLAKGECLSQLSWDLERTSLTAASPCLGILKVLDKCELFWAALAEAALDTK